MAAFPDGSSSSNFGAGGGGHPMQAFFTHIIDGEWENPSPNGVYEAKYAAVVDWRNNSTIKLDRIGELLDDHDMAHLAVRDGIHDGIFKSMIKYLKSKGWTPTEAKALIDKYLKQTYAIKKRNLVGGQPKITASDGKKTIDSLLFKRVGVDAEQEPPKLSLTTVIGSKPNQYKIFTNHYDIFPELSRGNNLFISAFTIHHFFDTLYEIQNDIAETHTKRKNRIKNLISDLLNAIDDIRMPQRGKLVDHINGLFPRPCIKLDDDYETEIIDDGPFDIDMYETDPAQSIITWPIQVSLEKANLWLTYMGKLFNEILGEGYNVWHMQLPSYTSLSISRKLRREIMMNDFKHLMKERAAAATQPLLPVFCVVDNGSANAQIDLQYKELKVHGIIFDMKGSRNDYNPPGNLTNMNEVGMSLEQWQTSGFTISFRMGNLAYSMFIHGGDTFNSVQMKFCLMRNNWPLQGKFKMFVDDAGVVSANKNEVLNTASLLINKLIYMMRRIDYDMSENWHWLAVLQFAGLTKHAGDIGQALSILAIQPLFPHLTLCASTHDSWLTLFYKMCERLERPIRFMRTKLSSITEELKTFFTIDVNVEASEQAEIVLYDNASVWASRWGLVEGEIQKVLLEANYGNYFRILGFLEEFIKFLKKTGYRFPQQTKFNLTRGPIFNLSHFFLQSPKKIVSVRGNRVDYNNIILLWQTFNGFARIIEGAPLEFYNQRSAQFPNFGNHVKTMLDSITKEINKEVSDVLQRSDDGGESSAGGGGGESKYGDDYSMGGMGSNGGGKKKKRKKKTRRKKKRRKKKRKKKTRRNKRKLHKKKRKTRSNKKK